MDGESEQHTILTCFWAWFVTDKAVGITFYFPDTPAEWKD